jgi:hypothetical protein
MFMERLGSYVRCAKVEWLNELHFFIVLECLNEVL